MGNPLSSNALLELIQTLALFNDIMPHDGQSGVTRLAYSKSDELAHQYIIAFAKQQGLSCRQDAVGNIFITQNGNDETLPAVATGSHLDTVPQGGRYDGILGVVAGLYALTQFKPKQLKRNLELIIFRSEESSRFGISCVGSKILSGNIDYEKWQTVTDSNDKTLFQSIDEAGYTSKNIEQCILADDQYAAFVELHIEQGKCLETENKSIGIVNGIAAPTRFRVDVFGHADHSGATPMGQRQDALVASASLITAINKLANNEAYLGTVATVGKLDVSPNAMNVIPGHVRFYIDIRGIHMRSIERVAEGLQQAISHLQNNNHFAIKIEQLSQETPVKLNLEICNIIKEICKIGQVPYLEMISGAGHDAMYMAQKYPTAMIFVPSKNGVSHHHEEFTHEDDMILGANLLTKTLAKLANQ